MSFILLSIISLDHQVMCFCIYKLDGFSHLCFLAQGWGYYAVLLNLRKVAAIAVADMIR